MSPTGIVGYLPTRLAFVGIQSQLSSTISSPGSPTPTTDTRSSAGADLPFSSAPSHSGFFASLSSRPTMSGTALTSFPATTLPTFTSVDAPDTSTFSTFKATSTIPLNSTSTTRTPSYPYSYSSIPLGSLSSPSSDSTTLPTLSLIPVTTSSLSGAPGPMTTIVVSTTIVTSPGLLSSPSPSILSTSTYTFTSFLPGPERTTTEVITSSIGLSPVSPVNTLNSTLPVSSGAIAAIVLGIVSAVAFAVLWLLCARRRHRRSIQATSLDPSANNVPGPLEDEVLDIDELGYATLSVRSSTNQTRGNMEERYANILAALHLTERFGGGNEDGSTGGVYGSRCDVTADVVGEDEVTRASSSTLPFHAIPPDDPPYSVLLSPPPTVSPSAHNLTKQPTPPPTAYYMNSRRKSFPGPDTTAWFGGYSVAPSCTSHYARSQTLGSGSCSGSVDALPRTRSGSEEPLLGIGKMVLEVPAGFSTPGGVSPTTTIDFGSNKLGFGSAFGSPATSMYSPSSIHPILQHDTDVRTVSQTGSYGYARSGTPTSFDALRSVSSRGAISNTYSQAQSQSLGFRMGFSRPGSPSSASTGNKRASNRQSFGVPPTSFRPWKDWSLASSDREKQNFGDKRWRDGAKSPTCASSSENMEEKQGRGSPAVGVRALLGRLRRGNTPSPQSSYRDLPTKALKDVVPEKAADRSTPSPNQIQVVTPRQRFSFILSNPDPNPPSPYSRAGDVESPPIQSERLTCDPKPASCATEVLQPPMVFPSGSVHVPAPSPAPTEESRLVEGLLHPRLRSQGRSDASLRDFEDYSRPIGGVVKNRLYSTTTFGTGDDVEAKSLSRVTLVQDGALGDMQEPKGNEIDAFGRPTPEDAPRDSWLFDDPAQSATTHQHSL